MTQAGNLTTDAAHIDDMDNVTVIKKSVRFDGYTWRANRTYTSQGETWVMIRRRTEFGWLDLTVNAVRVSGL